MNRQKHKLSRRILAVLLMAAMLITMLPSAMFAAPNGNSGQETIYTDKQTAQEATGVTANKSVSGPDDEGNYTITLTAKGGTSTSDVTKYLSADVALIIDSSGSMDFCGGTYEYQQSYFGQKLVCDRCGQEAEKFLGIYVNSEGDICEKTATTTQDRMDYAQDAAKSFTTGLLENEKINVNVGLADFSGGNNLKDSWSGGGNRQYVSLTDEQQTLTAAIDGLYKYHEDGTNYEAGLAAGQNILKNSRANAKFIVFISDGDPGYNSVQPYDDCTGETLASQLKREGITIITVGIDMSSDQYLKAISSRDSDGDAYCYLGAADGLQTILSQITETIQETVYAGTNAVMTDVINTDVFELVPESQSDNLTTTDNKTLTWEIGNIGSDPQTASFKIKVKDGNTIFDDEIPTNDSVSLIFNSSKQDGAQVEFKDGAIGVPTVSLANPEAPANTINIDLYVDGSEVADKTTYDSYLDVAPVATDWDSTSGYDEDSWNEGSYADGVVYYSRWHYDCKDINFTANNGYVIEGIEADVVNGQSGWKDFADNDGTITVDNVNGGSTVKVHLRSTYTVNYYEPNGTTVHETQSGLVADKTNLTANSDPVDKPVAGEAFGDETYQEMAEGQDPVTPSGKQQSYPRVYVADGLSTTTTVPALPTATQGTEVNGWWLEDSACEGDPDYQPTDTYVINPENDSDKDKVINFYSNSAALKYDVEINYIDGSKEADNQLQEKKIVEDRTEYTVSVSKDQSGDIPFTITKDGVQYVFDKFSEGSFAGGKLTEDATITAEYLEDKTGQDGKPDGVPDEYQATVTYQVENGTWSDNKTEPITVLFNLKTFDPDKNAWVDNNPTLGTTIPQGMIADKGYSGGSWDTDIKSETVVTKEEVTYTYTFNAETFTLTYDANGGKQDTAPVDETAYNAGNEVTLASGDKIEHSPADDGTDIVFVGWSDQKDTTIYSADDEYDKIPLVEKVKFDDNSITVFAIWGYDKNNNGTADVKEDFVESIAKNLIDTQDEKDAASKEPYNIDLSKYDFPADGVVTMPNGESVTLLYAITVTGDADAEFTVEDNGATLIKTSGLNITGEKDKFTGKIPESGKVTFYVEKTFDAPDKNGELSNTATVSGDLKDPENPPSDTEKVPGIPTPDIEALVKDAVQVDCITEGADHGDQDPVTYGLIKDAYTVTGAGSHYEISINADQAKHYIALYNSEVEPDHVYDNMPGGNTIILNYKGDGQWDVEKSPIVIAVKCAAPDDVMAFDKNVITSNDIDQLPDAVKTRNDYAVPAVNEDGQIEAVTVPADGTITLLYVIKVEGNEGTAFTVADPGADLIYSDYDVTEGDNDTFTGTISKDGSATFYVTRTFTSDDVGAEAEGMLRNSASITVDDGTVKEDEKDEDEDVPAEVGPETDVVKVTPADVTIYEGGKVGYDAVGEDSANSNSLPHPMFYIYTPDGVNADGLTFGNGEKTWTAVYDGKDAEGNPLYHFTEGEGKDPVRVTYTYVDQTTGEKTTVLADDLDELDNVTDVYTYLRIDLYAGDNNLKTVKANVNGVGYAIDTASGRLTVRAVEADEPNRVTSDIRETAPTEDLGTAVAVEPENTTYTFNDTKVVLPADSQPSLLFDNIINDEGTNRTAALEDKADQKLNANDGDYNYEIMYLDLVDANNGNAWIKSSAGTDIYWDYPEGTDRNTDFEVLHFKGLHREGEKSGFDINDLNTITMDEIENVTIEKTDDYIVFHVKEANFSPYALAWEDDSGQDWPPYYPWHPDGDDDGPSGLNTEDHFSYVVGYAEDYRTGEATDDEDLWPVKPNNQITRAEVATIFYRLLEDEVRDEYDTTTNDFSDVTADSWYNQTVSTLARMGIVKGYEDGSFRPNAPITRAEFGAIATRFFAETGATYVPGTFSDVTGDEWYANAIQDAVNLGLIGGYPDGTVRPNNNITRAEACAIVNRTLGRVPDADHLLPEDVMKVWPDNNPTDWFYADMQEATNGHEYAWIEEDGHEIEEWTNLLDKDWTDR